MYIFLIFQSFFLHFSYKCLNILLMNTYKILPGEEYVLNKSFLSNYNYKSNII